MRTFLLFAVAQMVIMLAFALYFYVEQGLFYHRSMLVSNANFLSICSCNASFLFSVLLFFVLFLPMAISFCTPLSSVHHILYAYYIMYRLTNMICELTRCSLLAPGMNSICGDVNRRSNTSIIDEYCQFSKCTDSCSHVRCAHHACTHTHQPTATAETIRRTEKGKKKHFQFFSASQYITKSHYKSLSWLTLGILLLVLLCSMQSFLIV